MIFDANISNKFISNKFISNKVITSIAGWC